MQQNDRLTLSKSIVSEYEIGGVYACRLAEGVSAVIGRKVKKGRVRFIAGKVVTWPTDRGECKHVFLPLYPTP